MRQLLDDLLLVLRAEQVLRSRPPAELVELLLLDLHVRVCMYVCMYVLYVCVCVIQVYTNGNVGELHTCATIPPWKV